MDEDLMLKWGIAEAREALASGKVTSEQLTKAHLDQARGLNGALNAFVEIYAESAMEEAKSSDARRAAGKTLGALDGIPIAIKDNILVRGRAACGGSNILRGHIAASDSTVATKLKAAGVVFIGRTNMDEFAMGSSTERSAFGPTKHPRDQERVPGGSSGGSAVAVAADMCVAALGSDTGGSIRQPASFCGIVGLKPTYGRVSRSGLMALASSLDQIGPMTKTVEDAALLLEVIQGADPMDQTTSDEPAFKPAWRKDLKGLRIGLPRQAWGEGMSKGVREQVTAAIEVLKTQGASVSEVDLPFADEALAVYYVLMPCEVSANLARFDGMRFGQRAKDLPLTETYLRSRAEGFGPEARRRILLGTFALSRGYYDAYYLQAKRVQSLIRQGYEAAFRDVDILLMPTAPTTAFKLGEKTTDPLAMYLEDIFTVGVNVAGLPAVSVPCGQDAGLPVGLQLIGKHFDEATVLATARVYEQASKP